MTIKHFWGVALVLLPYIVKIGTLNDNRGGIDYAFSCFTAVSVMLWGIKQDKMLGMALSIPMLINLLVQYDFSTYFGFSQNFMYITGSVFVVHIASHIKDLETTFHKAIIAAFYIAIFHYVMTYYFNIDLRLYFLKIFDSSVKIKSIHGSKLGYAGFLGNPNLTGAFYALSIASFLKLGKTKQAILPTLATLLTSAWPVCTAIALWLFVFWDKNKLNKYIPFMAVTTVMGLAMFFLYTEESPGHDSGRFVLWYHSMILYLNSDNWMLGKGMGWFATTFPKYFKPFNLVMRQEHNEFLTTLYAFGPIGLGILLYAFYYLIKTTETITKAAIFAIFVNCICNFPLHISSLFVVCGFWAAIAYKEVSFDKKMERQVIS